MLEVSLDVDLFVFFFIICIRFWLSQWSRLRQFNACRGYKLWRTSRVAGIDQLCFLSLEMLWQKDSFEQKMKRNKNIYHNQGDLDRKRLNGFQIFNLTDCWEMRILWSARQQQINQIDSLTHLTFKFLSEICLVVIKQLLPCWKIHLNGNFTCKYWNQFHQQKIIELDWKDSKAKSPSEEESVFRSFGNKSHKKRVSSIDFIWTSWKKYSKSIPYRSPSPIKIHLFDNFSGNMSIG